MAQNPLFESLSTERPSLLSISFASDPSASLGVQLTNHDNGLTNEMFSPGYASVANLIEGETLAKKAGVKVGDYIVSINGEGFRRFPPDFKEEELKDVTEGIDLINFAEDDVHNDASAAPTEESDVKEKRQQLKDRVMNSKKPGETYEALLTKIRQVKSSNDEPLLVSMERYSYDSRVHSWSRFLSARNGNVPSAMTMIQAHERWRSEYFPIDLTSEGMQRVLKAHAVSEIDVTHESDEDISACVYIDFAKLQSLRSVDIEENDALTEDVIRAFVVYTETLLAKSVDPRRPKTCQFVDLTGVSLKQGLHAKLLRRLYGTFEPNYPETLDKMVMYPVPKIMASAVNAMLSFVNENTRKKFIITDDLVVVCKELGWNIKEIEHCGSVNGYMKKHLRHGLSFVFD